MEKKLYRSKDKKLAGVCGGVAEYINLDPTVVRLLWVLLCFVGAGILAYIIAAIIMPERPAEDTGKQEADSVPNSSTANEEGANPYSKKDDGKTAESENKTEFL